MAQQKPDQHLSVPITQGVAGTITWIEGNQMPGFGMPARQGSQPVVREVIFYEPVHFSKAAGTGNLYTLIEGERVASAETDAAGQYQIALPTGTYSVFTLEEEGLFGAFFDGEGLIAPVTVTEGNVTRLDILINYKAAY